MSQKDVDRYKEKREKFSCFLRHYFGVLKGGELQYSDRFV